MYNIITKTVKIKDIEISNKNPFVLIAGPCQLESRDHAMMMSHELKKLTDELGIPFIYKTSFDKANRTSIDGIRGLGLRESLPIFDEIRRTVGCPVLTDIHERQQCKLVSGYVDVLQIPSFLSRQTDLLVEAANTERPINVKKGQFMAPADMDQVIRKIESTGNTNILLCERGSSFGYGNLVVDFKGIERMKSTGYPVIFDATHSAQNPGGGGTHSTGDRVMVPPLARAAIAVGVAGIFIETHQAPDNAPSDGPNMMYLDDMRDLLIQLKKLDEVVK